MAISLTSSEAFYGIGTNLVRDAVQGYGGVRLARTSMSLVDIAYEVAITWQGSGDAATLDLATGGATGDVTGVKATRDYTFSGLPVANETIAVDGVTYTFKALSGGPTEITIGVDATATAANAATIIDANSTTVDASSSSGTLTITAKDTGEAGNAITTTESATNVTVGGATLAGGVDAVVITGDGVDYDEAALATATKIHGLLILPTAGSVTVSLGTVLKDTVAAGNGLQLWSPSGRTDLIDDLVITSAAANTACTVYVRASE